MNKASIFLFRSILVAGLIAMIICMPVRAGQASPQASIEVNTGADDFGLNPSDCSLREAVEAVNLGTNFGGCINPGGAAIHLPANTYNLTGAAYEVNNATGDLNIHDSLTISGDNLTTTIINGPSGDRIMRIANDKSVTINNVTLQSGHSPTQGGALFNAGILTLNSVEIYNNTSQSFGGGIFNSYDGALPPIVTLNYSRVYNNTATATGSKGGGIAINGGYLNLNDSSVDHNVAYSDGGGIWTNTGYTATITHSLVYSNTSQHGSGGNINNFGPMHIEATRIHSGFAAVDGGNIYTGFPGAGGSIMTITNSDISFGSASGNGGGIANDGVLTVTNSSFYSNSGGLGGAIFTRESGAAVNLDHVTISGNLAGVGGGFAIYNDVPANPVVVHNSILSDGFAAVCVGMVGATSSYNIDSSASCGLPGGLHNLSSTNPLLGAFNFYGPAYSMTFTLAANSPAVDTANSSGCPATDQRGVIRPIDGDRDSTPGCDRGAHELQLMEFLPLIRR